MQIIALPALWQRALSQPTYRAICQQGLILIAHRLSMRIQAIKADPFAVGVKQHQRDLIRQLQALQYLTQLQQQIGETALAQQRAGNFQ
ncbi:hypothetical protein D3C80_649560 [compost metagenome]